MLRHEAEGYNSAVAVDVLCGAEVVLTPFSTIDEEFTAWASGWAGSPPERPAAHRCARAAVR